MTDDTFVTVDLTTYRDRVGGRIPEGRYLVQVEDAEMDQSKAGNPMINVWYRVLDGDSEGATIVDRLTITEKAMFRVVGFMQAIGLPTPKKKVRLSLRQFVGKTLQIDVEDGEPYNGRIKSEVRGYLRVTKKAPSVATGEDFSTFTSSNGHEATNSPDDLSGLDVFAPQTDEDIAPAVDEDEAELGAEIDLDDLKL